MQYGGDGDGGVMVGCTVTSGSVKMREGGRAVITHRLVSICFIWMMTFQMGCKVSNDSPMMA